MEERKKKNQIRARFSTILLCIPAILLCAAPCGWAVDYDDGKEHDVTTADLDYMNVWSGTTVNLYDSPVANSSIASIYAGPGSILNIYSGNVDWYISISPDEPYAVVTVFGTGFAVNSQPVSHGQVVINGIGELTGTYGNGDSINLTFYCPIDVDVPIQLRSPAVSEVAIDIKPGGNPNNINLRSKGVVPVAVFTTDDFNASEVLNPATVLFAGASHVRWRLCDVDGDDDLDMLFHFKTQDLIKGENNQEGLDGDSTEATLTGTTFGGEDIKLTDTVRIVQSKKE